MDKPEVKKKKPPQLSATKPEIKMEISIVDLNSWYWRFDLVSFCADNGLAKTGTKAVLIRRILNYFKGKDGPPVSLSDLTHFFFSDPGQKSVKAKHKTKAKSKTVSKPKEKTVGKPKGEIMVAERQEESNKGEGITKSKALPPKPVKKKSRVTERAQTSEREESESNDSVLSNESSKEEFPTTSKKRKELPSKSKVTVAEKLYQKESSEGASDSIDSVSNESSKEAVPVTSKKRKDPPPLIQRQQNVCQVVTC
eukprot:TRINITY_DN2954_c0_g1_i11.p1 TRINITY_DN2954_c0_g1~~TRINITY_DN2954_c0_g1_i11.p1  ORF type:complete len:253 (-),score=66.19 TRINITY_DN2954_c0_g1_i11:188-946(-)